MVQEQELVRAVRLVELAGNLLVRERIVRRVVRPTLLCSSVLSLLRSYRKESIINFLLPCVRVV